MFQICQKLRGGFSIRKPTPVAASTSDYGIKSARMGADRQASVVGRDGEILMNESSKKPLAAESYGAKYPNRSNTRCVGFDAKISMEPLVVGTIAILSVTAPSIEFKVETSGWTPPSGQSVR